jgi:hydroxymethylbilane synthase
MTQPAFPLKLGTRASPLALAQAEMVRDALLAAHGWDEGAVDIVAMTASGDRVLDRSLAEVGGKALWTKELDQALLDGSIDFAVHSMKDVETIRPAEISIAAMLPRADVRDRLIGADSIAALPQGARIGTNSPRRTAQLLNLRPDLEMTLFRGNVSTRLRRLTLAEADATLLAAAGLDRLGLHDTGSAIEIDEMLPAPAQGAIGIEARSNDDETLAALALIDHPATYRAVMAERAFLAGLSAGCQSSVACYAIEDAGKLHIRYEILTPDGRERLADAAIIEKPDEAETLAIALLERASPALRACFG